MPDVHHENRASSLLTPEHKQELEHTWALVAPMGEEAASLFYERLFEIDPSTRKLFQSVDMPAQRTKLVKALDQVVNGLDRPEDLLPVLEQLGRRHAEYGVVDSHYDSVGAALLWTLEQGLGPAWTRQAREAWTSAYALISNVMRRATVDVAAAIAAPVTVSALRD
ncbi:MAG: globin family protein [Gammaproteobacteria bacterium]